MKRPARPQKAVKEKVFSTLTVGIDPDNDPWGNYDDIRDNNSYAIDVTMYETAKAIFDEFDEAAKSFDFGVLARLKKNWLVPVRDPELLEIGTCNASDLVKKRPQISVPDFVMESPTGKKATREADKIVRSIEERQKEKKRKK